MDVLGLIRAVIALPGALNRLAENLSALNNELRKKNAIERLGVKRKRNSAAIAGILRGDAKDRSGRGVDSAPGV